MFDIIKAFGIGGLYALLYIAPMMLLVIVAVRVSLPTSKEK